MAHFPCRIRKYRKATHLSQHELATLVGLTSQGVVSDVETGRRLASLRTALAYALVFDMPVQELFPGLQRRIEQDIATRARRLLAKHASDRRQTAATGYLSALAQRLERPTQS